MSCSVDFSKSKMGEMDEMDEMDEMGVMDEMGEMGKNSRVAPPALNVEKSQLVWLPFSQSVNNINFRYDF